MNKKGFNALDRLVAVQDLDLRIRALEIQVDRVHARSVQEDPVLNKMRADLGGITESLDTAIAQQSMYETTLEDIRSAIKGLAATRAGAFKPRTRSSTEALKIEEEKLATLIEETSAQIERLKVQKEEVERSIARRSAEMQTALQEPEAEVRKLRTRIKRLEKQRDDSLGGIPSALLRKYERLRASRSGVGLTVMRNGICDVCRMTMPTGIRFRLLRGEMIELCPACGRMVAKVENTVSLAELTAREQADSVARRSADTWEEAEEDDRDERESFDTETELETVEEERGEGPEEEGDEERGADRPDRATSAKRLARIKAAGSKRAAEQKGRASQRSAETEHKAKKAKKPEAKKPEAKRPEAKKPEAKRPEAKKPEAKKPVPKPAPRKEAPKKPAPKKPAPRKPVPKKPVPKPAPKKPAPRPVAKKKSGKKK